LEHFGSDGTLELSARRAAAQWAGCAEEASGQHPILFRRRSMPYCQKIVNGQLFALAECLGDTNAADSFLRESTRYS
jgi:hypothetical protein